MSDPIEAPEDPDQRRRAARELGDAVRASLRLLQDASGTDPGSHAQKLQCALRDLTNAILAISPRVPVYPHDEAEIKSLIEAGVPPQVFTSEGRRAAEDWLIWSAIRDQVEREALDHLTRVPLSSLVPGLPEALEALPDTYTDLDARAVLRSPDESLDGLSPIQWLVSNRDPARVVELFNELGRTL